MALKRVAHKSKYQLGQFSAERLGTQLTSGITRRVKIGERTAHVTVEIDWAKFAPYARNAVGNAGGTCRAMNGAVVFRVVKSSICETELS